MPASDWGATLLGACCEGAQNGKALQQQRDLATARLERAIADSSAKTPESSVPVSEKVRAAQLLASSNTEGFVCFETLMNLE
jgi:hypothetical protein